MVLILAIASVNYISGRLGLLLALPPGFATAVWPPSGVALGAVLLLGYRIWPGVWLGSFAMNIFIAQQAGSITDWPQAATVAACIAIGSTLQAIAGVWMIRRWIGFPNALIYERDIILFLLLGGPLSCLIAATVGVGTLVAAGFIPLSVASFQWCTWWIGDSIGVLVMMPLTLLAFAKPREIWRGRLWIVGAPLILAFAIAVAFFVYSSKAEQARLDQEMERQKDNLVVALKNNLDRKLDFLDAAAGLFIVSEHVSRADFHQFWQRNLGHLAGVQAIEWSPLVTQSQRAEYENRAHEDGIESFQFAESNGGVRRIADTRSQYAPVYFIEPLAGNEAALGYDLGSEPSRRAMLDQARDTGLPVASSPLTLAQESGGQRSILVARPLYRRMATVETVTERRENLLGFVVMVLRMGDMMKNALGPGNSDEFLIALDDASALPGSGRLFGPQSVKHKDNSGDVARPGRAWTAHTIEFAGRQWLLRVAPTTAAVANQRSLVAWAILIGGMMFTSILGAFLLTVTGRAIQVRDLMEARARADTHFRLAVEAAPSALILANQDGLMTLVNAQAEKLFGYDRQEMLGKPIEMLVPARYRGAHSGHRKGFIANPEARSMGVGRDLYGLHKSGSEVPVEVGLNTLRTEEGLFVLASIIDITERKRMDSRFRLTVEAAPSAMIMINHGGEITLVNRQTEKLFGYSREELLGKKVDMLVPSRSRSSHPHLRDGYFSKPVTRAMGVGRDLFGVNKDGCEIPIEIGLNPIETDEGAFVLASIIDITERKRAELALRDLNQSLESQVSETQLALDQLRVAQNQLVQQEKMASLGSLVAGVAHEINTPVGVGVTAASHLQQEVRALGRSVQDNTLSKARFAQALQTFEQVSDIILLNLTRAADLINSFKRVAVDQSSGERRHIKLKTYIEEVLLSLKPKLKTTKHRIELDCADDIDVVTTPGALSQILTNLVVNSITHAFEPEHPGLMKIAVKRDGERIELKFSDNGRGIPADHLSRVFDPFFTTRRGQGGSGLGLHIVFNLVHQTLGGTIQVASEPGHGTQFIIRF